jgi:hypothetical protein
MKHKIQFKLYLQKYFKNVHIIQYSFWRKYNDKKN